MLLFVWKREGPVLGITSSPCASMSVISPGPASELRDQQGPGISSTVPALRFDSCSSQVDLRGCPGLWTADCGQGPLTTWTWVVVTVMQRGV